MKAFIALDSNVIRTTGHLTGLLIKKELRDLPTNYDTYGAGRRNNA
jgi:hypothetical protein